ncbi:MAG: SNF2-related protein [Akkermansiaceae bacterium]
MPSFDESTLRKAASWQDFKEAQGLLNTGAVSDSESTPDGWKGSVRIGKRIYRTAVIARTPTWFDAKCSCPANQREGIFCPHAVATGLHLLAPKEKPQLKEKESQRSENSLPEVAWQIHFQGPWQKSIEKGRASVCLTTSDQLPSPADSRITSWLVEQKATSGSTIHLALNPQSLPQFLSLAADHPKVSGHEGKLAIEQGVQFRLADCLPEKESIHLIPSEQNLFRINDSFWKVTPTSISRISAMTPPPRISNILADFAAGKSVTMPKSDFVEQLETLESCIDFSASEWFASLQFISAEPQIDLKISGIDSKLNIEFFASYSQSLPSFENNQITTRNPRAESHARSQISQICQPVSDTSFEISDPEIIRTFLTENLPSFPSSWRVELSPRVKKLASSYVIISPKIEILTSTENSLEFNLTYQTESGKVIPPTEVRRLLRSKNSPSSKQITLSDDIETLIDPLFEELDLIQQNGKFKANAASAYVIKELCEQLANRSQRESSRNSSQVIHKAPVKATLRPYQMEGFSWLVDQTERFGGVLLSDDMGLGKTLQTIACIEHFFRSYSQPSKVLIIVTTSLLGNWKNEFARFAPSRRVVTLHGPKRDNLRDQIEATDVVLTTYGTLARDLAWHIRQEYSIAVIDEASLIRNPNTDHSKAVAKLNATRRIALTGTPVENSARDLWSIFRFVQPGWLGTRKQFQDRYEIPLKSPETQNQAATLLRLKTSPFTLRRTKSEVAPELPSKIVIDEFCTMSREQLTTYREIQKQGLLRLQEIQSSGQDAAARMQTLTTLLRMRQTCCDLALLDSDKLRSLPIPRRSAKLERLLEITDQSISSNSRILVFSQFQKQLVEIGNALEESGISHLRLDGKTRDRQSLVDTFQSPEGPPVFLISLKAGGYGLNLTAADVVIHFDPWWNPAAEAQATDRAHRIGQTKPVTVFRLLTRNTVEEKVVQLQNSKKNLAESLDENTNSTESPSLTADEIEKLLRD